jgi:hypothetical protein
MNWILALLALMVALVAALAAQAVFNPAPSFPRNDRGKPPGSAPPISTL